MTPTPVVLIAQREVRQRLRSRAFLVFTVLIAVIIVGIGVLARGLSDSGPDRATVAVVGDAPSGLPESLREIGTQAQLDLEVTTEPSRQAAVTAVESGDADAALVAGASGAELLFHKSVDAKLEQVVGTAWQQSHAAQRAADLGLTGADISTILSPPPVRAEVLEREGEGDDVGRLVGTLTAILLFISVSTFGGFVLTGVVEEKTSAVIEILLAHVRAHQLLAGKVLGIGLVALLQFATAVAAGVVALRISGATIPGAVWLAVPSTLFWFVAGFLLYSTLFALAGSFVSRQEDAQAAAAPISLVFLAAYLVVFSVASDPGGAVATALSLLPPFAPLLMPLRIASGVATWWQVVLAAALLAVSVYGVLRAAGRIYARTLLHRGTRVSWKQAFRLQRS